MSPGAFNKLDKHASLLLQHHEYSCKAPFRAFFDLFCFLPSALLGARAAATRQRRRQQHEGRSSCPFEMLAETSKTTNLLTASPNMLRFSHLFSVKVRFGGASLRLQARSAFSNSSAAAASFRLAAFAYAAVLAKFGQQQYFASMTGAEASFHPVPQYPSAVRDESIQEDYHGVIVKDPYRWLENPENPDTIAFVKAQNAISSPFYATPMRDLFYQKLEKAVDYPKLGLPLRYGNRWFFWYNPGLRNHSMLYTRDSLEATGTGRLLIDPNSWSEEGTSAVDEVAISEDGSLIAYTRAECGSDWKKIFVLDVKTGALHEDVIDYVKFCEPVWSPDNKGFFYNRYDMKEGARTDGQDTTENKFLKVFYHELGTSQESDILIMDFPDEPLWLPSLEMSTDHRTLILYIHAGSDVNSKVWIANLEEVKAAGAEGDYYNYNFLRWTKLCDDFEAAYHYVASSGDELLFVTSRDAPRSKLVAFRQERGLKGEYWSSRTLVQQQNEFLEKAVAGGNLRVVLVYLKDVSSEVKMFDFQEEKIVGRFKLPKGIVSEISAKVHHNHLYFSFASFNTPHIIYKSTMKFQQPHIDLPFRVFWRTEIPGLEVDQLEVEQRFFSGKDGQKIPLFLVHRKDILLTPKTPTLLYVYGGFNYPMKPYFSSVIALRALRLGITHVVANVRGGGEYGKAWHEAARKEKKQVTIDDVICAAEYLIDQKLTSPEKLVLEGASNGGFVVAACANQRPELFKAVIPHVGVMDLVRFSKFTIGAAWIADFGDPSKEEDFKYIYKLSPLHNIGPCPGNPAYQYPALFLMAADHDDRVAPGHTLKFLAEVQYQRGSSPVQTNPLLLRMETQAGHGAGKPLTKRLAEAADEAGFLINVLHLNWLEPPPQTQKKLIQRQGEYNTNEIMDMSQHLPT